MLAQIKSKENIVRKWSIVYVYTHSIIAVGCSQQWHTENHYLQGQCPSSLHSECVCVCEREREREGGRELYYRYLLISRASKRLVFITRASLL